jgi:hypothetical protein
MDPARDNRAGNRRVDRFQRVVGRMPGRWHSGTSRDSVDTRSFAHYLWTWLEDAGREYGVSIEPLI